MLRKLLICGLAAGACGGLVATGFASVVGEPAIDRAIAFEDGHHHAAPAAAAGGPAPVSRDVQRYAGLPAALVVFGVALGGIFALAFAVVYGRVARAGPRATAYGLAAAAFTALCLVPFLKYPPTPPGVGDPATIGRRTALFLTLIAISLLAIVVAARARAWLARRHDAHAANLGAGLVFAAITAAALVALPAVPDVPGDYPAATLWRFREASLGMQAVLWLTLALVFGTAAQRVMSGRRVLPRRILRSAALPGARG